MKKDLKELNKNFKNQPTDWNSTNRSKSIILAANIQKRLEGKVLRQVDPKTWVYVYPGEEPKPVKYFAYTYID